MAIDSSTRVKKDSRKDDVAKQERWAVSTNKALSCKLVNTCKAIDTAREYQCKVFDIETKAIKRKWKSVINRKVELMFAEGYIPPGDVKLRCAPTQREKLLYQSDEYTLGGDPLYRPALYRIVGSLPVSEHELLREYARERVWRPQTAGPRLLTTPNRAPSSSSASNRTRNIRSHLSSRAAPPAMLQRPLSSAVPVQRSKKTVQRITSARA
ncbi:uncharacterized protein LOC134824164 isoform X1 [Bolinopsis microptera]|uniref:uncharacterized protein LOC134824164 isoform X1 n=1 Tax=Bolinopsis microptera TaxID=2820187 RepID=UPI003079AE58